MSKWGARKAAQRAYPVTECQNCGSTHRVQRHHPDLSAPLQVEILCEICHVIADQRDGTRRKRPMQNCVICGTDFQPKCSHVHKTCSPECLSELGRHLARKRWDKNGQTVNG
jgi:hypothetical protein